MRTVYILFIIFLITFSCSKDSKNPVDSGGDETLVANCGPDLIVKVGELAVADVSGCLPKDKSKIQYYVWESIDNNTGNSPVIIYESTYAKTYKHFIGFTAEGTYRFSLKIKNEKTESEPDTLTVNVLPRTNTLIEDPALEIAIRYPKRYATGEITKKFLSEVDSIYTIEAGYNNLEGIEYCNNLKYLIMTYIKIKDISPLSTLTSLEYIDMRGNNFIYDITPLANLKNLKYLNLYECTSLEDIEPLSNLTMLKHLDLYGCTSLKDIKPLSNLTNLEYLDVDCTDNMKGYSTLSNLVNLETLKIYKMNVSENGDISFISDMTKLKNLMIRYSGIKDITPIKKLSEVTSINLTYNSIKDTKALNNCKKIQSLFLNDNKLVEIECIRAMPDLVLLNLRNNLIEDITPLNMSSNLETIFLDSNKIYNIKPFIDNEYIGSQTLIELTNNPLDIISINEYIPLLKERGISIISTK